MQKYICENDDKNVIKLFKRDGRKEKNFALDVLNFFVQKITGADNDNAMKIKMGKKNENDDNSDVGDSKEEEEENDNEDNNDYEDDERLDNKKREFYISYFVYRECMEKWYEYFIRRLFHFFFFFQICFVFFFSFFLLN